MKKESTYHKVIKGETDLATTHPEIAAQWHPKKNGALKPEDVSAGSHFLIWWICPICGNVWRARVYTRTNGKNCPCNSYKAIEGLNDLATLFPALLKEWDFEKNKGILPNKVTAKSNIVVTWTCASGHSYTATIYSRVSGTGCSICNAHRNPPYILKHF